MMKFLILLIIGFALEFSIQAMPLTTGGFHSCAVNNQKGVLECWGSNEFGQLGQDLNLRASATPMAIASINPQQILDLVAGDYHSCVLLRPSGQVQCWGKGASGQLGNNRRENSIRPVIPQGLDRGVQMIAAGGEHTCALRQDQKIVCWGDASRGQMGRGTTSLSPTLTPNTILGQDFVPRKLVASANQTCATSASSEVWCWGQDYMGGRELRPRNVARIDGLSDLALGENHMCALTSQGHVLCYGDGWFGQNGDPSYGDRVRFTRINDLTQIRQISAGRDHSCAVNQTGQVFCWGQNMIGQLGNGEQYGFSTPTYHIGWWSRRKHEPQRVVSLPRPVDHLKVGARHSCALDRNQTILCWGQGWFGQIGDGRFEDGTNPRIVRR